MNRQPFTGAVLCLVFLAGCGSPAFLALPSLDGVASWILDPQGSPPVLFGPDEAVDVEIFSAGRLVGLPVTADALRVPSRDLNIDEGRPLPQLGSFRYEGGSWVASGVTTLRMPFTTADCEGRCFGFTSCPDCAAVDHVQACAACDSEPVVPEPPLLPSTDCPPEWTARDELTGHHVCSAPVPIGIEAQCPDDERWSMRASACVAIAPCAAPVLAPGTDVVFVDSSAPAGGDGTAQAPFQVVPSLRPAITVVFAPGVHEMPVSVAQTNVTLLGHGTCSTVTAPPGQDVVVVSALGLRIDRLKVVSQGTGRSMTVGSTASATVAGSLLQGSDRVVDADGPVIFRRSRVDRNSECRGACTPSFATLHLRGGGSFDEVDVSGPVPLWIQFENTQLRDTRLADNDGYRALYVQDVPRFSLERVAILGFGGGPSVTSGRAMYVAITDVLLRVELGMGGGFFAGLTFSSDAEESVVILQRVDLEGRDGGGVRMTGVSGFLQNLRCTGFHDAVSISGQADVLELTLDNAWLDFYRAGIRSTVKRTSLKDVWIQGCLDCEPDEVDPAPAICVDDLGTSLAGARIHINSPHTAAILAGVFSIDDLTVAAAQAFAPDGAVISGSTSGSGSRWDVLADGVALELRGIFDLGDISIRPLSGAELTPLCLAESANGSFTRFDVERSANRPSIAVLDFDSRPSGLGRSKLEFGSFLRGRVIEEGMDCAFPIDGEPAVLPVLHQVFQR